MYIIKNPIKWLEKNSFLKEITVMFHKIIIKP